MQQHSSTRVGPAPTRPPGPPRAAPGGPSTRAQPWLHRARRHLLSFRTWSLVPLILFVLLFAAYPIAQLVRMGFSTVALEAGEFQWEFSGLANFRQMLDDQVFHIAMRNTALFVVITTLVQLIIGTVLAIVVDRARFFGGLTKHVILWPTIIAPVVVSVIWWLLLSPQFGAINQALGALGLPQQGWLGSSTWALRALMLVDVWHWTPLVFLLVYTGLQAIDRSLLEAARVDGAGEWALTRHVVLPLLLPTIAAAGLIRVILAFKVFDEMYLLTGGGPGVSTTVLSLYIRDVFFGRVDMGYGAFLGLVVVATMLVIFLSVYILSRLLRRR